ncbi:hypothetical protein [Fulvivirga lutimaris]|uniref:hypothetical protein n=1 Tax=Fulvivirga lutimaris TaxID=1819566 RepID=UPI0012BC855B|nr:hypothetical protein [Fulvivirga lutimaris]MTI39520.1 hypothetical protein [Fulvivirga lutimaris]
MNTPSKKEAIIQSLKKMDDSKVERVMRFVNNLFWDSVKNPVRRKIKTKAMKQIQRALENNAMQAPF